jgi:alpha-1,3-mannosyltransferase
MGAQLDVLVDFLGVEYTSLSVYEGGSRDASAILLTELAGRMEAKGVTTHVMTGGQKVDWDHVHRIGALADIRNMVLKRLFEDVDRVHRTGSLPKYQTVVYLNDIVFCAADVLELLLQHALQAAHLTCPLDFGAWNKYKRPYYDLWVGRTMEGDIMYDAFSGYADGGDDKKSGLSPKERQKLRDRGWALSLDKEPFWKDVSGQRRARQGLPVQVYSCWNGGVVFDTRPVYEDGLKFRRGYAPECSESECSHFSKDLWNLGYGKIQVVPSVISLEYSVKAQYFNSRQCMQVGVAYSMEDFGQVRSAWESLSSAKGKAIPMYYLKSGIAKDEEEKEQQSGMYIILQ